MSSSAQSAVKKHRESVKYAKLAERLGAVASRFDTVSKMAVRNPAPPTCFLTAHPHYFFLTTHPPTHLLPDPPPTHPPAT